MTTRDHDQRMADLVEWMEAIEERLPQVDVGTRRTAWFFGALASIGSLAAMCGYCAWGAPQQIAGFGVVAAGLIACIPCLLLFGIVRAVQSDSRSAASMIRREYNDAIERMRIDIRTLANRVAEHSKGEKTT